MAIRAHLCHFFGTLGTAWLARFTLRALERAVCMVTRGSTTGFLAISATFTFDSLGA